MTKIFWTAQEWDLILPVAEMEFQTNHGERHWADCMDSAQHKRVKEGLLAPNRIRNVDSLKSYVRDIIIKQRARGKELLAEHAHQKQIERNTPVIEPLKIPAPPAELVTKIKELLKTPCDNFEQRLESIIDDSVNHLVGLFEAKLQAKLNGSILTTFGNLVEVTDSLKMKEVNPPKPSKPKLAVVGVMMKHLADFQKDFSEFFQIEFVDFKQLNQLANKLKNKDYVAINSAYISHTAQEGIKRAHPKNIIIAHGYNQLSDAILNFIVNSKELSSEK